MVIYIERVTNRAEERLIARERAAAFTFSPCFVGVVVFDLNELAASLALIGRFVPRPPAEPVQKADEILTMTAIKTGKSTGASYMMEI